VVLSQEEKIVVLESRNKVLEDCETWFLKWNYGLEAKEREDLMADELKSRRNISNMCQLDFESGLVNAEWRFRSRCSEQIKEISDLRDEGAYYKRLYQEVRLAQDSLEGQLVEAQVLNARKDAAIAQLELQCSEEQARSARLDAKIEAQVLKEQGLAAIIDMKERVIEENRLRAESDIGSLRAQLATANEDYVLKEAAMDKLLEEKAMMKVLTYLLYNILYTI